MKLATTIAQFRTAAADKLAARVFNLSPEYAAELVRAIPFDDKVRRLEAALDRLMSGLDELGFDGDDDVNGADVVAFLCREYPRLKEALK